MIQCRNSFMEIVFCNVGVTSWHPVNNLGVGKLGEGYRKYVGHRLFQGSQMLPIQVYEKHDFWSENASLRAVILYTRKTGVYRKGFL